MTDIIDFTNCGLSPRNLEYGGRAGEKKGIIYNNNFWILKFPKNTSAMQNTKGLSYVTSPLSEYIGSNIYKLLGYDAHETILGIYNDGRKNKVVCACKDFINNDKNELLIPYTALRNDTNPIIMEDKSDSPFTASNINEIIFQLEHNTVLSQIPFAKQRFWDVVIIDMLINNNDRNEDNWGVIKFKNTNTYNMSPIYDCGNCFYSKATEERISSIMADKEKLESSATNGITAYENDDGTQIRNDQILNLDNLDLNASIKRVFERVVHILPDIEDFINNISESYKDISIISPLRKEYYITTFKIRLEKILKPKYELLLK
ncbi:MAG: CtkA family protein [Clostridia bacterium]|nr:CtkA family protein [Clostridia bacterium]